jgi:hypothetical protein
MAQNKVAALTKSRKAPENQPTLLAFAQKAKNVYALHAAWCLARGQQDFDAHTLKPEHLKLSQADRAEDVAVWGMIRTRSAHMIEIWQKLEVYRSLAEQGAGEWSDQRDSLLLASIALDLERGEHGLTKERADQEAREAGAE